MKQQQKTTIIKEYSIPLTLISKTTGYSIAMCRAWAVGIRRSKTLDAALLTLYEDLDDKRELLKRNRKKKQGGKRTAA